MKQTLPDYIKQNGDLHKVLLAQEGGIMKYLAEHLDANGTAELFSGYQDHCTNIFFEKNKWDLLVVWEGDNMRRAALGQMEHIWKELRYQRALKPFLAEIPAEVAEKIELFTEQYLTYAYRLNRQRRIPKVTPRDIYRDVIELYSLGGLAYKSMELILKEHHAKGNYEKNESELQTEFLIRQYLDQLTIGVFAQIRQAVSDMLIGKTKEQCRRMALDTMKRVRGFSQNIYTDVVVLSLRESGFTNEADEREHDGEWLREVSQRALIEAFSDHVKTYSLRFHFAQFVSLLQDVGQIWAAQLLVHKIDMRELEDEVACIMNPDNTLRYYVDKHYSDDLPDQYFVSDDRHAKELFKEMGHKISQKCYLKLANEDKIEEDKGKLYRAYNILTKEGFIDEKKTKLMTFLDVLMNNANKKVFWQNDSTRKFLKELLSVFLGLSKKYDYPAILAVSDKGKQWTFVKQHFVDENNHDIEIKSNSTKIGKKDTDQFERILKAIYFYINHCQVSK